MATSEKLRHPVKAKAREGRTKHRLVADPIRGPVVTQIFLWRAIDRLGYDAIALRLNLDPQRYPPPDPILGEGRRRIGAWTAGSVREVLDNPKHTGFMVWNRRKQGHQAREVKGRVNPPVGVGLVAPAHPRTAGHSRGLRRGQHRRPVPPGIALDQRTKPPPEDVPQLLPELVCRMPTIGPSLLRMRP
jgi:hypothetical protein